MSEPRSIELSVEVPGTVEEVWETIATGPGITSWFTPMTVEEREGGEVVMDFGDFGRQTATVTAWEPTRRVVFEGGEPRLAYEWTVEARDGGTCVVRLVNSGFGPGEEWDDQLESMSRGWAVFLEHLRLQLTHFRGQRSRTLIPMASTPGPRAKAWTTFCDALGVPDDLTTGDRFETSGDGAPALAGRVEGSETSGATTCYWLLLDDPAPGTAFVLAEGEGDRVMLSIYLYLYGAGGEAAEDVWSPWLAARFDPAMTQ